jgi:hypothetical protein
MTLAVTIAPWLVLLAISQDGGTRVGIGDLTSKPALVGQTVIVEGRQPKFTFHRGTGWDEFRLLKSPVRFRLPRSLSYPVPPSMRAARVRGVLKREGGEYAVDVAAMEELPADLDRLNADVARLAAGDVKGRDAWARWAESRAEQYDDEPLRQAARKLAGDVYRVQATLPGSTEPERQVALARDARRRGVPEPGPSALAHRGFRGLLDRAKAPAEAEALAGRIAEFFPDARNPAPAVPLRDWQAAYRNDPAEGYRRADPTARATFDRLLLADALEKALDLKLAAAPREGLALARQARAGLPDRPEVANRLRQRGLEAAEAEVGSLRLAEVQELAKVYREEMNQPERANELLRLWLDDQRRERLSAADAEGRLLLADQYERLIGDKTTAIALLREAWTIDPGAKETAEAFHERGYRRVGDEWVASAAATAAAPDEATKAAEPVRPRTDQYEGLTREEVRGRIGKPKTIARIATQGQVIEQWIYEADVKGMARHINFLVRPDQPRPVVVSHGRAPVAASKPLR